MAGLLASKLSLFLLLLVCYVGPSMGVLFSSLNKTLVVTASPTQGQVLNVGDKITVTWSLNQSLPAVTAAAYKKVKVILCYAPASQVDRTWRKTNNDLSKDKTCPYPMTTKPYGGAASNGSYVYTIEKFIPTGSYFVRTYALNASGTQVAFGQTTNATKSSNLFEVAGLTGRHPSLDIAAGCFSAFSIGALIFFYIVEISKR